MKHGTHVSHDGYHEKIIGILQPRDRLPAGAVFLCYGRLVTTNGRYVDAPHVALYGTPNGRVAQL